MLRYFFLRFTATVALFFGFCIALALLGFAITYLSSRQRFTGVALVFSPDVIVALIVLLIIAAWLSGKVVKN